MALQKQKEPEVFYTLISTAKVLDVSKATIARWKKAGKLPKPVFINGVERYSSYDIDHYINQQNPHRALSANDAEASGLMKGA